MRKLGQHAIQGQTVFIVNCPTEELHECRVDVIAEKTDAQRGNIVHGVRGRVYRMVGLGGTLLPEPRPVDMPFIPNAMLMEVPRDGF